MDPLGRLIALLVAGVSLSLLIIAAALPPNPSGMGTHTGMHLPSCGFLETTGLPCPSCGMTTSFAWFARGNFLASLYVQPMGFALALSAGLAVWIGFYEAITAKPLHRLIGLIPHRYTLWPALVLAVAAWGWKIAIHMLNIDGWR